MHPFFALYLWSEMLQLIALPSRTGDLAHSTSQFPDLRESGASSGVKPKAPASCFP